MQLIFKQCSFIIRFSGLPLLVLLLDPTYLYAIFEVFKAMKIQVKV